MRLSGSVAHDGTKQMRPRELGADAHVPSLECCTLATTNY